MDANGGTGCLARLSQLTSPQLLLLDLAHALRSQLSQEGIEEARKLLVGRKLNLESLELRNYLVETCTIMGEQFQEYDEWLATEKAGSTTNEVRSMESRELFLEDKLSTARDVNDFGSIDGKQI